MVAVAGAEAIVVVEEAGVRAVGDDDVDVLQPLDQRQLDVELLHMRGKGFAGMAVLRLSTG